MPLLCSKAFRLGLFLAAAAPLPAQIVFTITGTADSTSLGYTAGLTYTFTMTLNDYAPTTPVGGTSSTEYDWSENPGDPVLWASVAGDGLAGTWTPPTDPQSYVFLGPEDSGQTSYAYLDLTAQSESSQTGLTANGNNLYYVEGYFYLPHGLFDVSSPSLPNPVSYFAAYVNTYDLTSTGSSFNVNTTGASASFTVTSLQISAVPEPSTYALAAGLAALAGAGWWRRKQKRAGPGA